LNILPTSAKEWLGLISAPFKGYIIGVVLVYPYWRSHMPGRPGELGAGDLTDGMIFLSIGYFASFAMLTVVAIVQMFIKNRSGAKWSIVFALIALCAGIVLIPPSLK
jgi:hypothetical protein